MTATILDGKATLATIKAELKQHSAGQFSAVLHFEVTPWAFKKGLTYQPRVDQYTIATEVLQVGS